MIVSLKVNSILSESMKKIFKKRGKACDVVLLKVRKKNEKVYKFRKKKRRISIVFVSTVN